MKGTEKDNMRNLKDEKLDELLTEGISLVDYYADWCGPCKMLAVELEDLENINIVKVNTDQHQDLAREKGVMSIPFVEIYKGKELVSKFIGFKTKDEIEEMLKEI